MLDLITPFFGIILIFCTKKNGEVLILMRIPCLSAYLISQEMMIIISILLSQIRKKKKLNFIIGER